MESANVTTYYKQLGIDVDQKPIADAIEAKYEQENQSTVTTRLTRDRGTAHRALVTASTK